MARLLRDLGGGGDSNTATFAASLCSCARFTLSPILFEQAQHFGSKVKQPLS